MKTFYCKDNSDYYPVFLVKARNEREGTNELAEATMAQGFDDPRRDIHWRVEELVAEEGPIQLSEGDL